VLIFAQMDVERDARTFLVEGFSSHIQQRPLLAKIESDQVMIFGNGI
jgi:hypothetical protein